VCVCVRVNGTRREGGSRRKEELRREEKRSEYTHVWEGQETDRRGGQREGTVVPFSSFFALSRSQVESKHCMRFRSGMIGMKSLSQLVSEGM